ncbi:hypothetical protein Tco_0717170 [Tanacetum coccineum]
MIHEQEGVRPRRRDAAYLQTQLLIAQKEEAGIQLQAEEFELMAVAADLDKIKEVNANCILIANLQQASTSGTQTGKAPIYDSDESAKEKSTVSSLLKEKKRLKSDFKIRKDELIDKQIQLENKIKELDNILVKTGQSIQTMHMLSPKPDSFYHTKQKMALEKHDPPAVYDSEETLLQNLEIQFLKEAAEFVRDFKSLANEADESLAKHKALELEIERLFRAIENEYAKLWNDWYKKCEECKYDKISYDKAYNDMQQKIERLQAQLGDQKGKSKDTPCVSNTLDPLSQKLENENVELEFQVRNYEKEIAHLKTTYKNLFDSISVTRAQTKTIIDSLQNKLHDTIYENAKLRAQLFDKVSEQVDTTKGTSTNTKFANQSTERKPSLQPVRKNLVVRQPNAFQSEHTTSSKNRVPQKVDETNDLSKPVTSNSVPTPQESKIVKHDNVIAPGMFRINPFKPSREEKYVPNKVRASRESTVVNNERVIAPGIFRINPSFNASRGHQLEGNGDNALLLNPDANDPDCNNGFAKALTLYLLSFSMTGSVQYWLDTLLIPHGIFRSITPKGHKKTHMS